MSRSTITILLALAIATGVYCLSDQSALARVIFFFCVLALYVCSLGSKRTL